MIKIRNRRCVEITTVSDTVEGIGMLQQYDEDGAPYIAVSVPTESFKIEDTEAISELIKLLLDYRDERLAYDDMKRHGARLENAKAQADQWRFSDD